MNPLEHYNISGWKELRDPTPFFDTSHYLENNIDVLQDGMNPLEHFMNSGWREGRNPNAFFDTKFYLANNPRVRFSGMNPIEHYISSGATEGRLPSLFFDGDYYFEHNPVVAQSGLNPLEHFLISGFQEGRKPDEIFESSHQLFIKELIASPEQLQRVNTILNSNGILIADASGNIPKFPDLPQNVQNEIKDTIFPEDNFSLAQVGCEANPNCGIWDKILGTGVTAIGSGLYGAWKFGGTILSDVAEVLVDSYGNAYEHGNGGFVADIGQVGNYEILTGTLFGSENYNTEFPIPVEPGIKIEVFPGDNVQEAIENSIFTNPVDNPESFGEIGILTTPQENIIDRLTDSVFVFPGETEIAGPYVLSIDINGNPIGYNPDELSNIEERNFALSWDQLKVENGTLNVSGRTIPKQKFRGSNARTLGEFHDPVSNITPFSSGESTIGNQVREEFRSAGTLSNDLIDVLAHAEGHAAATIRTYNLESGVIFINRRGGPCRACRENLSKILNPGQMLRVIHLDAQGRNILDTFIGGTQYNQSRDRIILDD